LISQNAEYPGNDPTKWLLQEAQLYIYIADKPQDAVLTHKKPPQIDQLSRIVTNLYTVYCVFVHFVLNHSITE